MAGYKRKKPEFALRPATWRDLTLMRSSKYDEALDFLALGLVLVAELPKDPKARYREIGRLTRSLRRRARQRGAAMPIYTAVYGDRLFISTEPLRPPRPSVLGMRVATEEEVPLGGEEPIRRRRLEALLKQARLEALERGQEWVVLGWKVPRGERPERLAHRLRTAAYRVLGTPRDGVVVRVLAFRRDVVLLWKHAVVAEEEAAREGGEET